MKESKLQKGFFAALLLQLFFLTVVFFPMRGTGDVSSWLSWMNNALDHGIVDGYALTHDNYPPLTIIILWCVGKAALIAGLSQFVALKLSLWVFLVATTLCVWFWTRDRVFAVVVYLAFALSALGLVYTDIYFAPTLILALWALQRRRFAVFSLMFALTFLIKYQVLIFAPFFAVYILSEANQTKSNRVLFEGFLPTFVVLVVTFAIFGSEFPRTFRAALHHTMLNANALNFNWLLTWGLHAGEPKRYDALQSGRCFYLITHDWWILLPSKTLFYAFYTAALALYARGKKEFARTVAFAVAGFIAYFMFNVGVHENHLFAAALTMLSLSYFYPTYRRCAFALTTILLINLMAFYGLDGAGVGQWRVVYGLDFTMPLAFLTTCSLLASYLSITAPLLTAPLLATQKVINNSAGSDGKSVLHWNVNN